MPTAVLAVDFATHAPEIVRRALPVLVPLRADVVLLYQIEVQRTLSPRTRIHPDVAPSGVEVGSYLEADARAHLQPLVDLVAAAGLPVTLRLGVGPVVPGIVAAAKELDAALLVVGCDVRSGLGRLFAGSFTESILRDAPCPVLVIRATGELAGTSEARAQVWTESDG